MNYESDEDSGSMQRSPLVVALVPIVAMHAQTGSRNRCGHHETAKMTA